MDHSQDAIRYTGNARSMFAHVADPSGRVAVYRVFEPDRVQMDQHCEEDHRTETIFVALENVPELIQALEQIVPAKVEVRLPLAQTSFKVNGEVRDAHKVLAEQWAELERMGYKAMAECIRDTDTYIRTGEVPAHRDRALQFCWDEGAGEASAVSRVYGAEDDPIMHRIRPVCFGLLWRRDDDYGITGRSYHLTLKGAERRANAEEKLLREIEWDCGLSD